MGKLTAELGNTASSNYAKMNDNFHRIGATERRLSHEQKVLADKFDDIDSDERKMMRKSLFIELRTFVSDYFQNFMFQLGQVLRHNRLDPVYEVLFGLLRDHEYCYSSTCYSLPIFNSINHTSIQISVTTAKQSLARAAYISCTILPGDRTSIFSHQIALLNSKDQLDFQADQLPSIDIAQLVHPDIDQITRPLRPSDFIAELFFPLYSHEKISLQCLKPTMVEINLKPQYCDKTTLNFIDFPSKISVNNREILTEHIPHHFSSKLDFMSTDLRSVSLFRPTNSTDVHLGHKFSTFFHTAGPLHYSLIGIILACIMLFIILFCCCCYLKIPHYLHTLLCCCDNSNCFKNRVQMRMIDLEQLKYF